LRLSGNPYSTSAPGATRYRLDLATGRRIGGRKPVRPAGCPYYENPRSVELAGLRVASGVSASGRVDTRATSYTLQLSRAQQPGRLDFPLDRLSAGAGFVLVLKGKTRQQSGTISEATARITFVPRAS
jgi:hypothetical protein